MTCRCDDPAPTLNRYKDGKYGVVCLHCLRAGYKARTQTDALQYWDEAVSFRRGQNPQDVPAGFCKHPFLHGNDEEE